MLSFSNLTDIFYYLFKSGEYFLPLTTGLFLLLKNNIISLLYFEAWLMVLFFANYISNVIKIPFSVNIISYFSILFILHPLLRDLSSINAPIFSIYSLLFFIFSAFNIESTYRQSAQGREFLAMMIVCLQFIVAFFLILASDAIINAVDKDGQYIDPVNTRNSNTSNKYCNFIGNKFVCDKNGILRSLGFNAMTYRFFDNEALDQIIKSLLTLVSIIILLGFSLFFSNTPSSYEVPVNILSNILPMAQEGLYKLAYFGYSFGDIVLLSIVFMLIIFVIRVST